MDMFKILLEEWGRNIMLWKFYVISIILLLNRNRDPRIKGAQYLRWSNICYVSECRILPDSGDLHTVDSMCEEG